MNKREDEGKVLYIVIDGEFVDTASQGDRVSIILDKTPFYAQSGGQVADSGYMQGEKLKIRVEDVKKTQDGKFIHVGVVEQGQISVSDTVKLLVDKQRRENTAKNHTTTHLLQRALKNVLGEHVSQAGSMVDSTRLRFDFNHFSPITKEELQRVEDEVNEKILQNLKVETVEMNIKDAKKLGATALFDEKYQEIVRVVKIGDYSMELCGGTHLDETIKAGLIKIISQSGVAAGVRRIEAVTGGCALNYYKEHEKKLNKISEILKIDVNDIEKKAEIIIEDLKNAYKEIDKLKSQIISYSIDDILKDKVVVDGVELIVKKFDEIDDKTLRSISDVIKDKLNSVVVVLASVSNGKITFVASATKDLLPKGVHVGNLLREIAKITKGGGGGRPDNAQAGGSDVSKLDVALKSVEGVLRAQLKN